MLNRGQKNPKSSLKTPSKRIENKANTVSFIKLWVAKIWNALHNSSFSSPFDPCPKIWRKGILGLEEVQRRKPMMINHGIRLAGTSGGLTATSCSEQDQLWDQTTLVGAFPVWS